MTSRTLVQDPALLSRRLFTREEFERAGELGLFRSGERLELIGGEVVRKMSPQKTPHATSIGLGEKALREAFGPEFHVRNQLPLAIGDLDEPEPDLCVVRGSLRDYEDEHPTTAVLVLEVADSSVAIDRTVKASLYASAGIPDYWMLNLPERALEVFRDPEPDPKAPFGYSYRTHLRVGVEGAMTPLHAPGRVIAVADLLPRA